MSAEAPPDYAAAARVVTLFGCFPLGLAAHGFAQQATTRFALGDAAGALRSADKARRWCWIGAGAGVVIWGLGIYSIACMFAEAAALK
jgi:hypothetical protein